MKVGQLMFRALLPRDLNWRVENRPLRWLLVGIGMAAVSAGYAVTGFGGLVCVLRGAGLTKSPELWIATLCGFGLALLLVCLGGLAIVLAGSLSVIPVVQPEDCDQ